jgi:hypothetical protein
MVALIMHYTAKQNSFKKKIYIEIRHLQGEYLLDYRIWLIGIQILRFETPRIKTTVPV